MTSAIKVDALKFAGMVANVFTDKTIEVSAASKGPPKRIDGYSIGVVPVDVGPGPHRGELHPDGDEFLYVVSGTLEVVADDGDQSAVGAETVTVLRAGEACVVPRGTWHRVTATEPSVLLHVTPGPNGPARPLQ